MLEKEERKRLGVYIIVLLCHTRVLEGQAVRLEIIIFLIEVTVICGLQHRNPTDILTNARGYCGYSIYRRKPLKIFSPQDTET